MARLKAALSKSRISAPQHGTDVLARLACRPGGFNDRGSLHDARFLPPMQTDIVFSHVDFSYEGENRALSDIKARIPRGARVAL